MQYSDLDFTEVIKEAPSILPDFPMATMRFGPNREIIKEPYTHSDYYNRFMQRETLRDIACREKQLAQYDWEDTMRLGIGRMNEWDRGYYQDNPYCYGWEMDSIPKPTYEEDYYEENSDDELSEDEEEFSQNNEADEIFVLDD
tara:strand:+ start:374 stop:802 length:429 start_codon:yes stop_codon:yes gene_type:complete